MTRPPPAQRDTLCRGIGLMKIEENIQKVGRVG